MRYLGETAGTTANDFHVPDVALFDAGVHYDFGALNKEWKGLSGQVNATNLFNTKHISCQSGYCYLDEQRDVIGSLVYRW